ncbi:alpha/beta fold hydrolase [Pigmentiphaga soli]
MPDSQGAGQTDLHYRIDDHTDPWVQPPVVLFVHGFAENTQAWRTWVPAFSRHFRVVRFDQRGFGESPPVDGRGFSTAQFVQDLHALMQAVSPRRPVHLVAGKSGGISAVAFGAAHPDRLASLTLVSPALQAPDTTGWLERMEQGGMYEWARSTMRQRLGDAMPEAGIEWWSRLMGATRLDTALAYMKWVSAVDCLPLLAGIRCPALVLAGNTARRGREAFLEMAARMPNGRYQEIEVDGYHAAAVAPDRCAAIVTDFIADIGHSDTNRGDHHAKQNA